MRVPEKCFTRVGSGVTRKYWTRLERPIRYKHSSLLQTLIKCEEKKFYNIGPYRKVPIQLNVNGACFQSTNQIYILLNRQFTILNSGGSTVAEHCLHHPNIKGLNPAFYILVPFQWLSL
jgi:hypothetical protein